MIQKLSLHFEIEVDSNDQASALELAWILTKAIGKVPIADWEKILREEAHTSLKIKNIYGIGD